MAPSQERAAPIWIFALGSVPTSEADITRSAPRALKAGALSSSPSIARRVLATAVLSAMLAGAYGVQVSSEATPQTAELIMSPVAPKGPSTTPSTIVQREVAIADGEGPIPSVASSGSPSA